MKNSLSGLFVPPAEGGGMEIKMRKLMVKVFTVILICMSLPSAVLADGYQFYIESENEGYNSNPSYKYPGHASAMVNVSMVQSGPKYGTHTDDLTRITHFLVIASNAVQISTDDVIGPGYGTKNLTFYSAAHEGSVMLRANSTSTGTGYWVTGAWTPNN